MKESTMELVRQLEVDVLRWEELERRIVSLSADELAAIAGPLLKHSQHLNLLTREMLNEVLTRLRWPSLAANWVKEKSPPEATA